MYRVYENVTIGHEVTEEFKEKSELQPKRRDSSNNISLSRYQNLSKSTIINQTTLGKDIRQKNEKIVRKIAEIVQHREGQLQNLTKAVKESEDLK